jgi:hypothetical protein
MTLEYQKQLSTCREREEKATGDILTDLSCLLQTHIKDKGLDAKGIWDTLKLVHVQQVLGMCFSVYNELFSVVKGADETLPAVALCVEDTLARVNELCPATVKLALTGSTTSMATSHRLLYARRTCHTLTSRLHSRSSRPSVMLTVALPSPRLVTLGTAPTAACPARTSRVSSAASAPARATTEMHATRRTARVRTLRRLSRGAVPTATAPSPAAPAAPGAQSLSRSPSPSVMQMTALCTARVWARCL